MASAFKVGVSDTAKRIAPMFGNTMTFSVALQIVQPFQKSGAGTLIVLSLSVALGTLVLSILQAFFHKQLALPGEPFHGNAVSTAQAWSERQRQAIGKGGTTQEAFAIVSPAIVIGAQLLSVAETLALQFLSVLIGTIVVQEATDITLLPAVWSAMYAAFGVALTFSLSSAMYAL
jgi:hypothetical protein